MVNIVVQSEISSDTVNVIHERDSPTVLSWMASVVVHCWTKLLEGKCYGARWDSSPGWLGLW
jgi:hypothetical protein